MADLYEVLRPISAEDGTVIPAGTVVDASGWKHLHRLIRMGRVKVADANVETAVKPAPAKKSTAKKVAAPVEPVEVSEDVNQ